MVMKMNDWNKNNKKDSFDAYVDYQTINNKTTSHIKNDDIRNIKIAYIIAGILVCISLLPVLPIALFIGLYIWGWKTVKKQYLMDHPSYYQTRKYKFFHKYRFVIRGISLFIIIILVLSLMSNPIYIG